MVEGEQPVEQTTTENLEQGSDRSAEGTRKRAIFVDVPGGGEGYVIYPEKLEVVEVEYGIIGGPAVDGLNEGEVGFLEIDGKTVHDRENVFTFDSETYSFEEAVEREAVEVRS